MMGISKSLWLSLVLLLLASSCHATSCSTNDAKELYQCGNRAYNDGDLEAAWRFYESSWELEPITPGFSAVRSSFLLEAMWRMAQNSPEFGTWFDEELLSMEALLVSATATAKDVMDWAALSRAMEIDNDTYISGVLSQVDHRETYVHISLAKWKVLCRAGRYQDIPDAIRIKADLLEGELERLSKSGTVTKESFARFVRSKQEDWDLLSPALVEIGRDDQADRIGSIMVPGSK